MMNGRPRVTASAITKTATKNRIRKRPDPCVGGRFGYLDPTWTKQILTGAGHFVAGTCVPPLPVADHTSKLERITRPQLFPSISLPINCLKRWRERWDSNPRPSV